MKRLTTKQVCGAQVLTYRGFEIDFFKVKDKKYGGIHTASGAFLERVEIPQGASLKEAVQLVTDYIDSPKHNLQA